MLRRNLQKPNARAKLLLGLSVVLVVLAGTLAAEAQTMPELAVSVTGRVSSTAGLGTEKMAQVLVEWTPPLRPTAASTGVAFADVEADLETAPGSEVPLDPLERDDPGSPSDAPRAARRLRDAQAKEGKASDDVPFVLTPAFVRKAVDCALTAQGVAGTLERLDSLSSRARTSAMLPDTRLRAGRDRDQSLRLTPTEQEPFRYTQSGGVSFVLEAAVTFRLGRFLFAGEELSIERLRLAQARERQRVTATTINELLAWQRAWRRAVAQGARSRSSVEDLFESTLRLDVLTGGWFSAHQPATVPLQPTTEPSTSEPKPPARPSLDQNGSPGRAPSTTGRSGLPRQAHQTIDSTVPVEAGVQEQLERLAFSR